jgi:hypothetical protein
MHNVRFSTNRIKSNDRLKEFMQIREHRGFNIEVHEIGDGYASKILRKGILIHTVLGKEDQGVPFHSPAMATEAAREWIDYTYPPRKMKYF